MRKISYDILVCETGESKRFPHKREAITFDKEKRSAGFHTIRGISDTNTINPWGLMLVAYLRKYK